MRLFWGKELVKEEESFNQLDDCSKIEEEGELSIGNIIKRNKILLRKWLWRFCIHEDSLWHRVIQSRYELDDYRWDAVWSFHQEWYSP